MQLIPRYLVNDRIIVVSNDTGFVTEFRPVYSRTIKVYKGIDNTIQFRLLNADQKPVTISDNPIFVAFDENQSKIIERVCTVTDDGSSSDNRGMFEVELTENDLLNIQQQYISFNIYLEGTSGHRQVTYSNRNFDSMGIIYIDSRSYPGPKATLEVTNFYEEGDYWVAGSTDATKISAAPGVNGNEALHTIAVYTNEFVGTIEVQATLDNQISGVNNWTTVSTLTFDGTETEPVPANFNGVFMYMRFKTETDPTGKVTKILVRN